MGTVIELDGVGKRYRLGEHHGTGTDLRETIARTAGRLRGRARPEVREIWSLRDVSFSVDEGQALGIIGSNGAGKSTLLKVINGITTPTVGRSRTRGRIGSLLEVGTGFHGELTGLENTYLNGAILGMTRREVTKRLDDIVSFAGLEKFMDTPVKRYSSGMYLRLGFAVAAHMEADILLVDEVLAVGDAEFQRRCLGKMNEVEKSGRTVIFVSHSMEAIARLCSNAVWLDRGQLRAAGKTGAVVQEYLRSVQPTAAALSFDLDLDVAAQVRTVALSDDEARTTSVLPFGRSGWFDIDLQVHQPRPGLNVSCVVVDGNGMALLDESLQDGDAPTFDTAGTYRVRCGVPPVLTPGEYHLNIWLGTSYEQFQWHERVLSFKVEGDDQQRQRRVRLGVPWQVSGPSATIDA